jgi:hypothetical protein
VTKNDTSFVGVLRGKALKSLLYKNYLNCGDYSPGGNEGAYCLTSDHMMLMEATRTKVIAHLKYCLKNRKVHKRYSHMKFAWNVIPCM